MRRALKAAGLEGDPHNLTESFTITLAQGDQLLDTPRTAELRQHADACAEIIRERFFTDLGDVAKLLPAEVLRYGEAMNGVFTALGQSPDTTASVAMADVEDQDEDS